MTNETRQRIEAYKKALPDMRERVMSVAILLVMSITMMTSATFAWLTLSKAPEVTGMQTTVAANGNLEIALAQGLTKDKIVAPSESQVGDSSATEGKTIVDANVTWGNLVNVSDERYGLDKITLRPALLSEYNIKRNPLYGAAYGGDGRVVDTSDKYEFASWKEMAKDQWRFAAGSLTEYGVRAIGTVKYENVTGNATVEQFQKAVDAAYSKVNTLYEGIVTNDRSKATNISEKEGKTVTSIEALEALVTVFAQDKINEKLNNPTDSSCSPHIYYFYRILLLFKDVLDAEGEALLQMANWQAYLNGGEGDTNTFDDIEHLKANVNKLSDYGVTLKTLKGHITDYDKVLEAIDFIKEMALDCKEPDNPNNNVYTFKQIEPAVNKLLDINEVTLAGVRISSMSTSDVSKIAGSDRKPVVIHKGVLKDFEQRVLGIDARMGANVSIKVKVLISLTVNGKVTTAASGVPEKNVDYDFTAGGTFTGGTGEAVAEDTYGMAIDMWARTNYPSAVLTLEGSLVYEDKDVTGVDSDGNTVNIYVLKDEDTELDVYQKDGKWYDATGHTEIPAELLEGKTPKQKTEQIVIGYQGENRIWEDWETMLELGFIEKDATTQGAGSCYVFYADSPTDQAKILELLQSFTVAFVDQDGKTLSMASLNTEKAFANHGKVTVPLEITSGVSYTDENDNSYLGITTLRQNEPTWITAIVYLNGRRLNNENVLASTNIQGQLNIQFGTNATLIAPENEELQAQYRTITASVTVGNQTSTDKANTIQLDYEPNGHTAKVTLTVEGEQPEHIKGFFVRTINETQGTKGEEKAFTKNEDGTWSAEYVISAPGNYILNTLLVDGVQYNLHDGSAAGRPANHPAIHIEGLQLRSVSTDVSSGTHLSTGKSFPVEVTAKIDSVIEPRTVSAVFFNKNKSKQYTALMIYDKGNDAWVGTVNITESDEYILSYISVVSDTDTYTLDVPAANQTTLILKLGLTAGVYTTLDEASWNIPMKDDNKDGKTDTVTVPMWVRVWDDTDKVMKDLSSVKLYYHEGTSTMDKDGLEAQLTWTEERGGYYKGEFSIDKEGIYSADRIVVSFQGQSSPLYNLNEDAPVFTCEAFTAPAYQGSTAEPYQLALTDKYPAKYVVTLSDAKTATATATFVRTDGNGETLTVTSENRQANLENSAFTDYIFDLTQDGTWKLSNVHVVKLGNTFDFAEEGPVTKVVATIYTETLYDGVANEFEEPVLLEGAFLQAQTSKVVKFVAKDYAGEPIENLVGATWELKHDASMQKDYGGYTLLDGTAKKVNDWTVENLTVSGGEVSGTETFTYAGEYTTKGVTLSFKQSADIEETYSYKLTTGLPKFTVKSAKPTVKISGIDPNKSVPTKVTWTKKNSNGCEADKPTFTVKDNKTGTFSDYNATVYAQATADNSTQCHGSFNQPSLTLNVGGIDSNCKASIVLPGGSANNVEFSRSGSGTITMKLGKIEQIKSWTSSLILTHTLKAYRGHGEQEIKTMTISKGDESYMIELDNPLKINNPSSVDQTQE